MSSQLQLERDEKYNTLKAFATKNRHGEYPITTWEQRSGFMRFRDEVLDGILEKGYQVYDGILNFNERIPKVDRLEFNIHFDFGLRLDLSDSMGQIERSGLECWFDELYQKTGGQTSLVL